MLKKGIGIDNVVDMVVEHKSVSFLDSLNFVLNQWVKSGLLLLISVLVASPAQSDILGDVEVQGLGFISEDFENTEKSNYGFLGVSLKSYNAQDDTFKINLDGQYAVGESLLSYLNVKEVYFTLQTQTDTSSSSKIHIGRKLNDWSRVDEKWNLGLFQPQFRWNPLDVESQGLLGFFWEVRTGNLKMTFLGSPLFIPDQGANYELKDGQFSAANPWFSPPAQNIYFQNVLLPIDYNIQKPETQDVINQRSFALQIKYKTDSDYYFNSSAAYQPSNQFAFGYTGVLVTDRVRIDLKPKTYYEKNMSLDVGYLSDDFHMGIGAIYNQPEGPTFESNFNAPVLKPQILASPFIDFNLNPFQVELSYLFSNGQRIQETGPDANNEQRPALTQKILYHEAYQVSLKFKQYLTQDLRYQSSISWLQAESQLLKQITWKNIFDFRGPWKAKFDLLLVETSDELSSVSNYRNLDQIWLGASYDF